MKLVVSGAFFKPTMEMSPKKLERTRSASQDGAKAVVKVTLKFDTEGWEVANCYRTSWRRSAWTSPSLTAAR